MDILQKETLTQHYMAETEIITQPQTDLASEIKVMTLEKFQDILPTLLSVIQARIETMNTDEKGKRMSMADVEVFKMILGMNDRGVKIAIGINNANNIQKPRENEESELDQVLSKFTVEESREFWDKALLLAKHIKDGTIRIGSVQSS